MGKGREEENLRKQEQHDQGGGRPEKESKKRGVLIKGAIMGLARYLALEKFQGIYKNDPQLRP